MKGKEIPEAIKQEVQAIAERFNREVLRHPQRFYVPRFRGRHLYLDRSDFGIVSQICRLTFNGKIDNWDFAIFKYSSERYDPDESMFPGGDLVNGTVEGAMRAGLEAYPG